MASNHVLLEAPWRSIRLACMAATVLFAPACNPQITPADGPETSEGLDGTSTAAGEGSTGNNDGPTASTTGLDTGEATGSTGLHTGGTGDDSTGADDTTAGVECDADLQTDPSHCGACGHDCFEGACMGGQCQPVELTQGLTYAWGIVPTPQAVYVASDAGVHRVPQDVRGAFPPAPFEIVDSMARGIETDDERVYFALIVDASIASAALDGSDLQTLATTPDSAPVALALAPSHVVWLASDGLRRVAKTGGPIEILAQPDGAGYWAWDLAIDEGAAYWWTTGGALQTVSWLGGIPEVLAMAPSHSVIDATQTHLYTLMQSPDSAAVARMPIDGGEFEDLLGGQSETAQLVVGDEHVYWLADVGLDVNGKLLRMPLSGGPATVLAAGLDRPLGLAVDDDAVYFSELLTGRVLRLAK